jgi:hypothetical protein
MGIRRLTPRTVSVLLVLLGALLIAAGVALWSLPAGIIVAGVALVAFGLFFVDVGR